MSEADSILAIPVGLYQQLSHFKIERFEGKIDVMNTKQPKTQFPIIRKYYIGDSTYIAKATVKKHATEDNRCKIRRQILNDLRKNR